MAVSERLAWTGIVLAGGRSRRFGGLEKARLPLGGRPLLQRSLDALRPVTSAQWIVGGAAAHGAPALPDQYPDQGPLGGLLTALDVIETTHALVVACDLPFLTASFLADLRDTGARAPLGLVTTREGRLALCLSIRRDTRAQIHEAWARGCRRMRDLEERLPHAVLPAEVRDRHDRTGRLLMNVNDPLTYARALAEAEHD
jgi:molybdenum cofactor guanylyltransferase